MLLYKGDKRSRRQMSNVNFDNYVTWFYMQLSHSVRYNYKDVRYRLGQPSALTGKEITRGGVAYLKVDI